LPERQSQLVGIYPGPCPWGVKVGQGPGLEGVYMQGAQPAEFGSKQSRLTAPVYTPVSEMDAIALNIWVYLR
jgi:hypothetical protein